VQLGGENCNSRPRDVVSVEDVQSRLHCVAVLDVGAGGWVRFGWEVHPSSPRFALLIPAGGRPPYRGLFPSPPLFDRMPTYRTQGKRSLNFLSAPG
jgi:hypothetical protein